MHQPVMQREVLQYLDLKEGDIVLDATVGGAGHAKAILERILPGGRLIGLDADEEAIDRAEERLKGFYGSFKLTRGNFRALDEVAAKEGLRGFDAALFDVGISSDQLEDVSRGFSMKSDGPLDMRIDSSIRMSARDIVNRYTEKKLSDIIKAFGEERFHARIARAIVLARSQKPIETTGELAAAIRRVVGPRYERGRIDPATRTFQALRIATNDELGALEEGLVKAVSLLKIGGRISVISFHSLEDRIAKNIFREYSKSGHLKILTKKPARPSHEETVLNPRARSAKLRAAEKIA